MEAKALELIEAIKKMFTPQSVEQRGGLERNLREMTSDIQEFFNLVF